MSLCAGKASAHSCIDTSSVFVSVIDICVVHGVCEYFSVVFTVCAFLCLYMFYIYVHRKVCEHNILLFLHIWLLIFIYFCMYMIVSYLIHL